MCAFSQVHRQSGGLCCVERLFEASFVALFVVVASFVVVSFVVAVEIALAGMQTFLAAHGTAPSAVAAAVVVVVVVVVVKHVDQNFLEKWKWLISHQ